MGASDNPQCTVARWVDWVGAVQRTQRWHRSEHGVCACVRGRTCRASYLLKSLGMPRLKNQVRSTDTPSTCVGGGQAAVETVGTVHSCVHACVCVAHRACGCVGVGVARGGGVSRAEGQKGANSVDARDSPWWAGLHPPGSLCECRLW